MTLREEIRKLAEETFGEGYAGPSVGQVEAAIHTGIRRVLEREPSKEMCAVPAGISPIHAEIVWRAMVAELIKGLS